MAHYYGLATRTPSFRKPLSARAGKIAPAALAACAVLLPRLALAQLAPNANYDGQDLSRGDYRGQNAAYSSFQDTNLMEAILYGTNLYRANLSGANLSGANLMEADLTGSNISSAQVESAGAIYNIILANTSLPGVNLALRDLIETNFYQANLTGADLHRANLNGSNFAGAKLAGANLKGTFVRDVNLRSADLNSADLSNAFLALSDLTFANLAYANLSNADLRVANLTNANLREANLNGAKLAPSMPLLPVINGAVVSVVEGSTVTTANDFDIAPGGTLVVDGTLNFLRLRSEGKIQVSGNGNLVSSDPYGTGGGPLQIYPRPVSMSSGSSLSGTGTLNAFVEVSRGTIDPGNGAPGTLTIGAALSLYNSTLSINIASLSEHSLLDVTDYTEIFGNNVISINLMDGYTPFYGDTFEIFHTRRFAGFGTLTAPENWEFLKNNGTGTLRYIGTSVVVPESGTFALAGIAGLPLLYLLRSRRRSV